MPNSASPLEELLQIEKFAPPAEFAAKAKVRDLAAYTLPPMSRRRPT
jgi:hypothetical protein